MDSRLGLLPHGVDMLLFDRLSGLMLVRTILSMNRYLTTEQREDLRLNRYLRDRILTDFIGEINRERGPDLDFSQFLHFLIYPDTPDLSLDPLLIYDVFSILANFEGTNTSQTQEDRREILEDVFYLRISRFVEALQDQTIATMSTQDWSKVFMNLLETTEPSNDRMLFGILLDIVDSESQLTNILNNLLTFMNSDLRLFEVVAEMLNFILAGRMHLSQENYVNLVKRIIAEYFCKNTDNAFEFLEIFRTSLVSNT